MSLSDLKNILEKRDIILSDKMLEQLDEYASFLIEYNQKINLTSIVEYDQILDKHFYDSLLAADRKLTGTLVDVGTGAGFPGVVLKIVFPELKVILLEPIKKRCVFLEELIEKLNLEDIKVENIRGEDYALEHREEYDYVTARAVSNVSNLIEICGAMVKVGGYFICLRGKDGGMEILEAKKAIKLMGFEIENGHFEQLINGDLRYINYFKKIAKTSLKYPRKYNIIKRNPL